MVATNRSRTVQVFFAGDLKSAVLHYRTIAPGAIGDEESIDLVADGKGRYTAQIPTGSESNRLLRFRIVATDAAGGVASAPAKNDFRPAFTVYVNDAVPADKIPVLQFPQIEST